MWVRVAVLLVVTCGLMKPVASGAQQVKLPPHVSWVVDDTDPSVLAEAFSRPRDAGSGPDHQRAIHAITLNPSLREPTLALIADPARKVLVIRELDAAKQLRALTKPQPKLPDGAVEVRPVIDFGQ